MNNWDRIGAGFDKLLWPLVQFEVHALGAKYGVDLWWERGVLPVLTEEQRRSVVDLERPTDRVRSIDMAMALGVMDRSWAEVFRPVLSRDCRTWMNELRSARNVWAHHGVADATDDDAYRMLDTMMRLCTQLCERLQGDAAESAQNARREISALMREVRYGTRDGSTAAQVEPSPEAARRNSTATLSAAGLPSWRDVVTPHPDVAQGRYNKAEFVADLYEVARGTAAAEYQDPVEFFTRTYMTGGIRGLLTQALRRVGGLGGEPVIQLKTSFGGGKTHSMLALYHLLRGVDLTGLPDVASLVHEAGLAEVPKVHVATIVGTKPNPAQARRPAELPGVQVNTLWGEIAAQLAISAGRPELYEHVRDADRRHVSPGADALTRLFDDCGPCLVLIDELVAYGKKLRGASGLVAGTFDNLITFIQELTEAARSSGNSLVVASIPESDIEVGDGGGREVLAAIEHTFGRMESIWKPVTADEGFSVVSRRLFSTQVDEGRREQVCRAYASMYRDAPADFPVETREATYYNRLVACYPIHPELYDRLYEDWASIERFQRTRGVLRLMAAVIHRLWAEGDKEPLIMPGSLPLDDPAVRNELTRYLDEGWNPVVDSEVDGANSEPLRADAANLRFGRSFASRRVTRTVFLGSAPDTAAQNVRGIERTHLNLGVVHPGENVALFSDALRGLQGGCSYLYADASASRFWFDLRPALRKTAESRAQGIPDDDAWAEVTGRMRRFGRAEALTGLHVCPVSSADVPDERGARLVVLDPRVRHQRTSGDAESAALAWAKECLAMRGQAPRTFKNALVFLALDEQLGAALLPQAKRFLAWKSVQDDADELNLTRDQKREARGGVEESSRVLDARLLDACCWLLVPRVDADAGPGVIWDEAKVPGGEGDPVARAARKLQADEVLVASWAPLLLKMTLDRWLWRESDHVAVRRVWDMLNTYGYLERLARYDVLTDAIQRGLPSEEHFGIASSYDESAGRYLDLTLGSARSVQADDVLVKVAAARAQIERDREKERGGTGGTGGSGGAGDAGDGDVGDAGGSGGAGSGGTPPKPRDPTTFGLHHMLDPVRVTRDVSQIVEEVVRQLEGVPGTEVEMTFEVRARAGQGFPVPVVRSVSENCRTLRVEDFRFTL